MRFCVAIFSVLFFGCPKYGIYHRVKSGETIKKISQIYGVTPEDIIKTNYLKSEEVKPGSYIFIEGVSYPKEQKTDTKDEKEKKKEKKEWNLEVEEKKVKVATGVSSGSRTRTRTGIDSIPISPRSQIKVPDKSVKKVDAEAVSLPSSFNPVMPVDGVIISNFGKRDGRNHDGIDIKASEGTPIKSAEDGSVIFSGYLHGYGNVIIIKHTDVWYTVYAHNKDNIIKEGDFVKKNDIIGHVGQTGRTNTPHLHFEIRRKTQPVNPLMILKR